MMRVFLTIAAALFCLVLAAMPAAAQGVSQSEFDETVDELEQQIRDLKKRVEEARPGGIKYHLGGFAALGFQNVEKQDSTFSAKVSPILLWKLGDKVLFETELEFQVEGSQTNVELEYAHLSYLLNDYVTIGMGLFLNPGNLFMERLHPTWINKLPDMPLPFGHGGLQAPTQLGAQVRGGIPVGDFKFTYAVYLSNGPALNEGDDTDMMEAMHAGGLEFENFTDVNNGKAVGGRIGLFPLPELELGYGFEWSRVTPSGSALSPADVQVVLHSADANYRKSADALGGTVDLRFQWVWSDVDDANGYVFPTDMTGGSSTIAVNNNKRNGGYAQIAYRPDQIGPTLVKNSEIVFRFDRLDSLELDIDTTAGPPFTASVEKEKINRYSFGYNYWLRPSVVLKGAYELTDRDGASEKINTFILQGGIGF